MMPGDWLVHHEIVLPTLMSHLGYFVMMSSGPLMAGNLIRFQVTDDVTSGYLSSRSGQAWGTGHNGQISTCNIEELNLITLGVPKQYQPTKITCQ